MRRRTTNSSALDTVPARRRLEFVLAYEDTEILLAVHNAPTMDVEETEESASRILSRIQRRACVKTDTKGTDAKSRESARTDVTAAERVLAECATVFLDSPDQLVKRSMDVRTIVVRRKVTVCALLENVSARPIERVAVANA